MYYMSYFEFNILFPPPYNLQQKTKETIDKHLFRKDTKSSKCYISSNVYYGSGRGSQSNKLEESNQATWHPTQIDKEGCRTETWTNPRNNKSSIKPTGSWKTSKLVLIHIQGKPPDDPSSYKPNCLLYEFGKVQETMVKTILELALVTEELSIRWFGFRKGKSIIQMDSDYCHRY